MVETFRFGEVYLPYDHGIGNAVCDEGWCNGGENWPTPCKCGGLVHANFGDEDWDGYWLFKECDKCGEDYEELRHD